MKTWNRLLTSPALADFQPLPHPAARVLVRRDLADEIAALLTEAGEVRGNRVGGVSGGREVHPVLELPGGMRVVARRYRRGGLFRHLNRGRYFRGSRALEELCVTARAVRGGVRAPSVLAAIERPARIGYTATLVTELVPDARELAGWLDTAAEADRLRAIRAAGAQIARMHESGIAHPDLNLKNFLVRGDCSEPELWILDFDRAVAGRRGVARPRRARDLLRLGRSIRKLNVAWSAEAEEALARGYGSGYPLPAVRG